MSQIQLVLVYSIAVIYAVALIYVSGDDVILQKRSERNRIDTDRFMDDDPRHKRPFCNAFTGCGRKRSDESMANLVELNPDPAVEELSRQVLSEAKLWEALQEARAELQRGRDPGVGPPAQKNTQTTNEHKRYKRYEINFDNLLLKLGNLKLQRVPVIFTTLGYNVVTCYIGPAIVGLYDFIRKQGFLEWVSSRDMCPPIFTDPVNMIPRDIPLPLTMAGFRRKRSSAKSDHQNSTSNGALKPNKKR